MDAKACQSADDEAALVAAYLASRDVPCPNPKCGFNLRGLRDAACPECKEPLSLIIRRPEALWSMRKWVVTAASLTAVVAALHAEERIGAMYSEFGAPWIDWQDWVVVSVSCGVFIGLFIVLTRYILQSRHKNARALPLLLRGLLWAIIFMISHQAFWSLWGLWDRVWGVENGF